MFDTKHVSIYLHGRRSVGSTDGHYMFAHTRAEAGTAALLGGEEGQRNCLMFQYIAAGGWAELRVVAGEQVFGESGMQITHDLYLLFH